MSPPGGRGGGMGAGTGGRGGGRGMGPGMGRGAQWDGSRASRESRGRNLRGLLALLKPYRLRVVGMLTALVLGTAASLAPPLLARAAIDEGIDRHDFKTLVLVVVAFLAAALLVWLMTYVQTYLVGWVGQRTLADLRIACSHTCRPADWLLREPPRRCADLAHHQRRRGAGKSCHRLGRDPLPIGVDAGRRGRGAALPRRQIGALDVLACPFGAGSLWFRLTSAGAFRRTRETIGSITAYLQETLSGIRVVRSFGQEPVHLARFAELNEDNCDANMVTVRLNAAYFPAVEMLSGIAIAGSCCTAATKPSQAASPQAPSSRSWRHSPLDRTDSAALPALHHLPVGNGGLGEDLPVARCRAGTDRQAGSACLGAHPRRAQLRRCHLLLPTQAHRKNVDGQSASP